MADANIIEYPILNDAPNSLDSEQFVLDPEEAKLTSRTETQNVVSNEIRQPVEEEEEEEEEEITSDEIQDLFDKNTDSFRCLAQVLISRSSVLAHPLYSFDPPRDPGIENTFNLVRKPVQLDTVGITSYKTCCKEYEIVPISRVVKSLPTDTLDLRYYGLSLKQIKALSSALIFNRYVENLILEENVLDAEGLYHLSEMLRDNNMISYVNMRNCWIGPEAIAKLSEGIFTSQLVTELDLSYNNITSVGLRSLLRSIRDNMSIKKLNLSHNALQGDIGRRFGRALAENDCLEELDLSWNNLNDLDGLAFICEGLVEGNRLKMLNLAWNGISTREALIPIIKYMKATTTLEHLDLSNNQIQGALIKMIRIGILGNSSLVSINVGSNMITPEEASFLAHVFTADRGDVQEPLQLKYLDIDNVYVNKTFAPYWRKLTRLGKFVRVEGVLSNFKIVGPDVKRLLFQRVRYLNAKAKKKKARKEFGHFLCSIDKTAQPLVTGAPPIVDTEGMVKADFMLALKKFKMPKIYKDSDLLKEILKKYTNNQDKINTSLMRMEYYNYYPDTTIPEVKKKKRGGKKGKGIQKKKMVVSAEIEATNAMDANVPTEKLRTDAMNVTKAIRMSVSQDDAGHARPSLKVPEDIGSEIDKDRKSVNTVDERTQEQKSILKKKPNVTHKTSNTD